MAVRNKLVSLISAILANTTSVRNAKRNSLRKSSEPNKIKNNLIVIRNNYPKSLFDTIKSQARI